MNDKTRVWADVVAKLEQLSDGKRLLNEYYLGDNFEFLLERMSDEQRQTFESLLQSGQHCQRAPDYEWLRNSSGSEKYHFTSTHGNVGLVYRPDNVRTHWLSEVGVASMTLHPLPPEDIYDTEQYAHAIKEIALLVSGWLRDVNIPFYARLREGYAYSEAKNP